jgi:hypothetical protein
MRKPREEIWYRRRHAAPVGLHVTVYDLFGVRAIDTEHQLFSTLQLIIAPHVHVCVTRDGCVLLDLKRDKYLGLGRAETELLAGAIDDWPKPNWDAVADPAGEGGNQASTEELCRRLEADGMLIAGRGEGGCPAREPLPSMGREWVSVGDELEVPGRIDLEAVVNFVAAFVWARWSLGWRPMSSVVQSVRERKIQRGGITEPTEILGLATAVGVFRRLRPFLFAAENRCLLHALTLVRFLSCYDFYPDWLFGVATQPWAAHSWVQWGDYLLDSNPEKVCRYTPILAV